MEPTTIDLGADGPKISIVHGDLRTENADGSATFNFDGEEPKKESKDGKFDRNLASEISETSLSKICSELLTGIQLDIDSRKDWMSMRAMGIKLLGLKIENPRADAGTSSAPLEGMSTINHPLLLEAVVRFQANAGGEILPAEGPVKVRNDQPMMPQPAAPQPPPTPGMPTPPAAEQTLDELGEAMQKDFNHYLTVIEKSYVPDTDRLLFYVGFGGDGFKKVYHHPLRRRPVSESVDAEDIIISNAATDISNCGRVTHRILMRKSVLKRMQLVGAYRKVALGPASPIREVTEVEKAKEEVAGQKTLPQQPEDADYEIYECYCELDLPEFAPKDIKDEGIPLPYKVSIAKEAQQILEVRRNWDEADEMAEAKQFFVQFPFIRGLGFYGLGLVHLLGNVTIALTAIWRIMIDNGMFGNFPGYLFDKASARQNTNQLRVPPGGGIGVDVPAGKRLQDTYMPLPYKETGVSFMQFGQHVEEVGQRLGQTAEAQIGEGSQETPVGTIMAVIEQATKVIDSVHKRLHTAQAQEFQLLKQRFREDPQAFWRHNRKPARKWREDEFKQALDENDLVPVADPNNPTSLHRISKAVVVDMLLQKYPLLMDAMGGVRRILRTIGIDPEGLLLSQPQQPPPDPRMEAIHAKAMAEQMQAQIDKAKLLLQEQQQQQKSQDAAMDRQSKERMQQVEIYLEMLRVKAEQIIHQADIERDDRQAHQDMQLKAHSAQHDMALQHAKTAHDIQTSQQEHVQGLVHAQQEHQQELARGGVAMLHEHRKMLHAQETERLQARNNLYIERLKHLQNLQHEREIHAQKMQHESEQHAADLEATKAEAEAKAAAAAKAKPKPAGDKK